MDLNRRWLDGWEQRKLNTAEDIILIFEILGMRTAHE